MTDRDYMQRAIELAKKGIGWTSPNPMVGAVVVKDGRIIAEDYHHKCGEFHAERNALLNCGGEAAGAVLYVTLEPCCHFGKTPPCTDIIIEKGIKKVFIGSRDPNPKVSGKGVQILRSRGIEVTEDFMREECDAINPVFLHYIKDRDPYVVMKYAMTLDGKIATYTGESKWITGEEARTYVHRMRGHYASIMAGIGTVIADDPMLNCRIDGAHQPVRIICDDHLRIPLDSRIVKTAGEYRTIAACSAPGSAEREDFERKKRELSACGVEIWESPTYPTDLKALMKRLGEEGIDSCLIEGGGTLHYSALKSGIVNHVCAFIAPKIFGGKDAKTPVEGEGIAAVGDAVGLKDVKMSKIGEDILVEAEICLPG